MRKIILCSVIIIFAFVFSVSVGYYFSNLWKKENISSEGKNAVYDNNIVTETVSTEEKVAYNANFALKKYYNECGHFIFNYVELPSELINLSKSEIEKMYPDWRIEKFSKDEIVLAQNIDSMCDEHYVLKLGEDNIEIYNVVEADDFELFKTTNISKEYLTNADIANLEEGIYVYGTGNLNSALEDFE